MNRKLRLLSVSVTAILLLAALSAAAFSAQRGPESLDYDANVLDYGLYWFGAGRDSQKFVPGEANAYFDPSKPTVIFVHGWQPYISASNPPDFIYDTQDGRSSGSDDTVAAWISAGWNAGIFYWNQFSDEPDSVKYAEAKIWTNAGPQGMRWRQGGVVYQQAPPNTPSAGELFYQAFVAALTEQDYSGGVIRVAGHSLGNQMAVRLTKLVSEGIAAGTVPAKLLPDRVTLLDPYWSTDAKDYLDGETTGAVIRSFVEQLLPEGVLFEWYWSSNLTVNPNGDTNAALKPMMMYAEMSPDFVPDDMSKHRAAWNVYFWSYAFDGPAACSGSACLEMNTLLAKMSDEQLAAVMRSDYAWAQSAGATTDSPSDDAFQSAIHSSAPYTVTQLTASPSTQSTGQAITLTATVENDNGTLAGDSILVTFGTDLGTISARAATSGSVAVAHVTSMQSGLAHITATTEGAGGEAQKTMTVTFGGHDIFLPLVLRN
jgi:hypothetical protein